MEEFPEVLFGGYHFYFILNKIAANIRVCTI